MHGWGRQGCWLAHHTGCGKCTAWCSKHSFLTAKSGLACLYHIQKTAGYCPGSRQGSRLTQSTPGKKEGSNCVSSGVHRAEKGLASQDKWNHSIYNWRGLNSGLDSPGLVTEWCDSHSPGSGLPQQLAEKAEWGGQKHHCPSVGPSQPGCLQLDFMAHFFRCAVPRWIVLIPSFNNSVYGWVAEGIGGGWSREAACLRGKLASGRTTQIAWDGGMEGDAWRGRKSQHWWPRYTTSHLWQLCLPGDGSWVHLHSIFRLFHVCCLHMLR